MDALKEEIAGSVVSEKIQPDVPKKKKKIRKEQIFCILVVSLPFIGYIIFNAFPIGISIASMFTDIEHNQISTMTWNSFAHFKTFFHDARFLHSLGITFWLTTAQFVCLGIALLIATLLNADLPGSKVLRTLYFIPYICSTVAVSIMWGWVFGSGKAGVLNSLLGTEIEWVQEAKYITWCVYFVILWQAPSYGIVMLTAALRGVDTTLYEAAKIDGANAWKTYTRITLPQIAPMILFLALAGWQGGLATFDAVTVLAPLSWSGTAGPENMGLTTSYYIYVQGVKFSHMDYASVMQWAMCLITFVGSYLFLRLRKKAEENL